MFVENQYLNLMGLRDYVDGYICKHSFHLQNMSAKVQSHKKFAVKRTNTGLGLFTIEPISKGKRIIEYLGEVLTSEEADAKGGKYLFEINERFTIDGSARSNLARYLNHSCRPNAEAFIIGKRIWIWSKSNIKAGEAITIHYGKRYFDDHIRPKGCKCEACVKKEKRAKKAIRQRKAAKQ